MQIYIADASMRQLASLAQLRDGWNFGSGRAVTPVAWLNARAITSLCSAAGATKFEYFPEDEGGILIIAYRADESAEILARSDGKFEFAFENNQGLSPSRELANIGEVRTALEQIGWQSKSAFDSFTRVITASEKVVTHRLPSDPAVAAFRSLIPNALLKKGIRVVPMQNVITTDGLGVHPPYFGESERRNLLTAAS